MARDLRAEFKSKDDYDLTVDEVSEIIAQLKLLGVKRVQVSAFCAW